MNEHIHTRGHTVWTINDFPSKTAPYQNTAGAILDEQGAILD